MNFSAKERYDYFTANEPAIIKNWQNYGGTMSDTIQRMMVAVLAPQVIEAVKIAAEKTGEGDALPVSVLRDTLAVDAEVEAVGKFISLDNSVTDIWEHIKTSSTILFVKPVQSGKTSDILRVVEHLYRTHIIIMVSDKNKALEGQTNKRVTSQGVPWEVKSFREVNSVGDAFAYIMEHYDAIMAGKGKRKIIHFLMEVNNMEMLITLLRCLPKELRIALVIDEGDKNRNTDTSDAEEANKGEKDDFDLLPPITRGLLACKNLLFDKDNGSKCILVTATPQGVLCSEKDDNRLVLYKKPYDNYTGVGLDHPHNLHVVNCIAFNRCKAGERWMPGTQYSNSYYRGVERAVSTLEQMDTKDSSIKQIMLISLENHNDPQGRLANVCSYLIRPEYKDEIGIIVFNGEAKNKDKNSPLLEDKIKAMKQRKIIIISGFMASRGVSFTDFSDGDNKFELVIQVHAAWEHNPLNTSMQAMRIFGPARRTISRAILICNSVTEQDVTYNFLEAYRVCKDLACGIKSIKRGRYNTARPLTQKNNLRYMKQGRTDVLLFESHDARDHERITKM